MNLRVMQFRLRTPLTTRSLVPHPANRSSTFRSIVPYLQPAHQSDGNGSSRSEHLLKQQEYSEDEIGDGSDIEPSPLIATDAAYEDDDDLEDNGVSHACHLADDAISLAPKEGRKEGEKERPHPL
ncbi:MAG: hypothetical protein Q9161_001012 [Pseudevernia consocians]